MPNVFEQALRSSLDGLKRILKSNDTVRRVLYDARNEKQFTRLLLHERMLADRVRLDCYAAAIRRFIKPGDVVLDLGTGTGILSLFAALQRPRRVYAVDHSPIIRVAEEIARQNNLTNIEFVRANSRDYLPNEKVDVILHEQLGPDLLDEQMVENLLDLRGRALKEGGIILPGQFELFLEPVTLKSQYTIPHIWESVFEGLRFRGLKDWAPLSEFMPDVPDGYACAFFDPNSVEAFLCEPEPLLTLDLNGDKAVAGVDECARVTRTVVRAGRMDGWCLYFRVILDEATRFDTSPFSPRTHWRNRLYRTEQRHWSEGDAIVYQVEMEVFDQPKTWKVSLLDSPSGSEVP